MIRQHGMAMLDVRVPMLGMAAGSSCACFVQQFQYDCVAPNNAPPELHGQDVKASRCGTQGLHGSYSRKLVLRIEGCASCCPVGSSLVTVGHPSHDSRKQCSLHAP